MLKADLVRSILTLFLIRTGQPTLAVPFSDSVIYCPRNSYSLMDFDSGRTAIVAPNHSKKILLAKDGSFRILRGENEVGVVSLPDLSSNIEVVWAPDSEKFSITYSTAGAEGAFLAHIYRLAEAGVAEISAPVDTAVADFKAHHYCEARGNNVYVEGWTLDSNGVFIVTEVAPTGDCGKELGRLGGYLVNLNGKITHRYGNKETSSIQSHCEKFSRANLPSKAP